jgi:hypothetical protein
MLTNQLRRSITLTTICGMSIFVIYLTVTGLIRAYVFAGISHNRLVLAMETECIFCAVQTELFKYIDELQASKV